MRSLGNKLFDRESAAITATVICLLFTYTNQVRAEPRVTFGAFPSGNFVLFTANNEENYDVQCRFTVRASYANADQSPIPGFREVGLSIVLTAKKLQFREEAGRDVIEQLRSQFGGSPVLRQIDLATAQKSCDDNIDFSGAGYSYKGAMRNGLPDGEGTKTLWNGTTQSGMFSNGQRNGQFTETYPDGWQFEGTYANDERVGRGSLTNSQTGNAYVGEFLKNEYHGQGEYTFSDGRRYEGKWRNGKQNGRGILYYKDGSKSREGDWKDGEFTGRGTDYYQAYRNVGTFNDGKIEGEGTRYYNDGRRFEGQFKDNKRDGYGILYDKEGKKLAEGAYSDDALNGTGTLYFSSGKYVGNFLNGMRNGKGVEHLDSGWTFDGEFKNGKRDGYGKLSAPNNTTITKGYYEEGKMLRGGKTAGELDASTMSLRICNYSSEKAYSAVGYKRNDVWYAAGWFSVEVGACVNPRVPGDKDYDVYVYATTKTRGGGTNWYSEAGPTFCIDKVDRFEVSDDYCSKNYHSDLAVRKFYKLQWGDKNNQYTYNLR